MGGNRPCRRGGWHVQSRHIIGTVVFRGAVRIVWFCGECKKSWHEPLGKQEA